MNAGAEILHEIGALDGHVESAVIQDETGHAVLAEAAAHPVERVGGAARAVGEAGAALEVAVHPGIDHRAGDVADGVDADAPDMLDVDVADREADRSVGSGGDDADAVTFLAVAHDDEVGEREIAYVDAGAGDDLDDRSAARHLGQDLGPAEVDADRALAGPRQV